MFAADWFESEFMPSLYKWFSSNHIDEEGKEKPCFISVKQFNVFAKNSDMLSQDSYVNNWSDLKVICEKKTSKTGSTYYTVNFIDDFIEKFRKSGEYVLNNLLDLRNEQFPKLKEFAQNYYDIFMALLQNCEINFEVFDSDNCVELNHVKQLYQFCSDMLQAIGKFIN